MLRAMFGMDEIPKALSVTESSALITRLIKSFITSPMFDLNLYFYITFIWGAFTFISMLLFIYSCERFMFTLTLILEVMAYVIN
jgi:hypothetical protein